MALWWFTTALQSVSGVCITDSATRCLMWYLFSSLAYDIKLIMQRGVFDIVLPTWIKACAAKGEILPLTKK